MSEDAVIKLCCGDVISYPGIRPKDFFQTVAKYRVALGVVGVENSQAGGINETL